MFCKKCDISHCIIENEAQKKYLLTRSEKKKLATPHLLVNYQGYFTLEIKAYFAAVFGRKELERRRARLNISDMNKLVRMCNESNLHPYQPISRPAPTPLNNTHATNPIASPIALQCTKLTRGRMQDKTVTEWLRIDGN